MPGLLNIQTSVRGADSVTRQLSGRFATLWRAAHPGGTVVSRDLRAAPLPALDEDLIAALYAPADTLTPRQREASARSDALIAELKAAETVLIGAPMYNFSVPTGLKTWIDHVYRYGQTVERTPSGPRGLLGGKRMVVITASGGFYSQGPAAALNHHEPYLRTIFRVFGIEDITFIYAEGVTRGAEIAAAALADAQARIDAIAA